MRIGRKTGIFVTNEGVCGLIIITFVNNFNIFVLCGSEFISQIKSELAGAFNIVDMGPFTFYVRLKVTQD